MQADQQIENFITGLIRTDTFCSHILLSISLANGKISPNHGDFFTPRL